MTTTASNMTYTITQRIDTVTSIPDVYRKMVIPAPKSVKIELTSRCNFHCGFCSHHKNLKTYGDMDFRLFKRLAGEMRAAGVEELGMFYIGESFILPWLKDAIAYAKEIGFPYVFCTTNGSLANPDKVKGLMEAGLDSLKFSLNNADKFQFRNVTGMAPSVFDTIKENIKAAFKVRQEGKYKTRLYASSIKYTGEQQTAMQQLVDEIRPYLDEHYWLPLLSFGDQAVETEKTMGMDDAVRGNPGRLDTMRPPIPCWAVFREGHITHDGLLSACCFDNSNSWIMADLKEVTFMDGWNSPEFQRLRGAHLTDKCEDTPCAGCLGLK